MTSVSFRPYSDCEQKLELARQALKEYEGFVRSVQEGPRQMCVVLEKHGSNYTIAMHGSMTQAVTMPGAKRLPDVGEMWWFINGVLVEDVSEFLPALGSFYSVTRLIPSEVSDPLLKQIEIDAGGEVRTVMQNGFNVEIGDRVLLDPSGLTVQFAKPPEAIANVAPKQSTSWDNIGGLDEAKKALQDAVELPHKFPALFEAYGQTPTKGVLLLGPPGCGKTMLGKAVASSLASTHKEYSPDAFIYVKGPEVLSKWVGEAEATVRGLFARARKHKKKYGYDAVIFIDEADALLSARGSGIGTLSHTIVPQFLAEMDGLEDSGAVLILATNRPHALDPAVTREGRVDRKIRVTRPDEKTALDILRIHVAGVPAGGKIPEYVVELLWSDAFPLVQLNTDEGPVRVHLRHTVSGAMLAGLLQRAKGYAIRRDISSGKLGGIDSVDLQRAVRETHEETKNTRLDEVIREVAEASNAVVMSVTNI